MKSFYQTYCQKDREEERQQMKDDLNLETLLLYTVDVVCKKFGCGKILSFQEQLYGDYCIHCQNMIRKIE